MNRFILLAAALTSSGCFAATKSPDREIYDALTVKAINPRPDNLGATTTEKSVGGLVCSRTLVVVPAVTTKYACQLTQAAPNYGAIYGALKVKEVDPNPMAEGGRTRRKLVGGLLCTSSGAIALGAETKYECVWKRTDIKLNHAEKIDAQRERSSPKISNKLSKPDRGVSDDGNGSGTDTKTKETATQSAQ